MNSGETSTTYKEAAAHKLGYAQEFRQMLREHPGVIKTGFNLMAKAEKEYNPPETQVGINAYAYDHSKERWYLTKRVRGSTIQELAPPLMQYHEDTGTRGPLFVPGETQIDKETGLEVTLLGTSNRVLTGPQNRFIRYDRSQYFKMGLDSKDFFVKKSQATITPGGAEFRDTLRVKTALKPFNNVRVVEPQLGYSDKNISLYVSKWDEFDLAGYYPFAMLWYGGPNDYGKYIPGDKEDSFVLSGGTVVAKKQIDQIEAHLKDQGINIIDLAGNTFYNLETGQFVLLDVTLNETTKEGLNQKEPLDYQY